MLACSTCSIAWPPSSTCRPRGPDRLGGSDHPVDRGLRKHGRRLVEGRQSRTRSCRLGDRVGAGRIRTGDAVTCGSRPTRASSGADDASDGRRGDRARSGAKDDLIGIAGLGREAALQQIDGALRGSPRQREVARRLVPRARDREEPSASAIHITTTVRRCAIVHRVESQHRATFQSQQECSSCIYSLTATQSQQSVQNFFLCRFVGMLALMSCWKPTQQPGTPRAQEAKDAREDHQGRARAVRRARLRADDDRRDRRRRRGCSANDLRLLPEQGGHPVVRGGLVPGRAQTPAR